MSKPMNSKDTKLVILLGLLMLFASLAIGFYLSYYTSPHYTLTGSFVLAADGEDRIVLDFPHPASLRVFYELNCTSAGPMEVRLNFLGADGRSVGEVLISKERGFNYSKGMRLLSDEPVSLEIRALGNEGDALSGRISVKYSSIDYTFLSVAVTFQLVMALIAITMVIYGTCGYLYKGAEREVKKRA